MIVETFREARPTNLGFQSEKQLDTYLKFLERAFDVVQQEVIARMTGHHFNYDKWEKQVIKLHKAMSMMEKFKSETPHFSRCFGKLAQFLKNKRALVQGSIVSSYNDFQNSVNFGLQSELSAFDAGGQTCVSEFKSAPNYQSPSREPNQSKVCPQGELLNEPLIEQTKGPLIDLKKPRHETIVIARSI